MLIDYITIYDLLDRARWPSTQLGLCQAGAAIASGLSKLGCGANFIGDLNTPHWIKPVTRLKWLWYHHWGRDYYRWAEPAIVGSYGRQVSRRLRSSPGDIALCVENVLPIATVRSPKPLVLWTDAPLVALIGLYPYMSNLCGETRRHLRRWETRAFDRCTLVAFASDWAVEVACREYPTLAHKFIALPWGANLDVEPDRATVAAAIADRDTTTLELVFLGKEWERKGGPIALEIVAALRDRGLPVRLTIIGATPGIPAELEPHLRCWGYLNKAKADDRDRLQQALLTAHMLLLPTHAETYGHVFCEAAAFGLPAIAPCRGGIPTIVRDGISGELLPPDATAAQYAATIAALWRDRERYGRCARQARDEFDRRLNWAIACEQMRHQLGAIAGGVS